MALGMRGPGTKWRSIRKAAGRPRASLAAAVILFAGLVIPTAFLPLASGAAPGSSEESRRPEPLSIVASTAVLNPPGGVLYARPNASDYRVLDLRTGVSPSAAGSGVNASYPSALSFRFGDLGPAAWSAFSAQESGALGLQAQSPGARYVSVNQTRIEYAVGLPENATIDEARLRLSANASNLTLGNSRLFETNSTGCLLAVHADLDGILDVVTVTRNHLTVYTSSPGGPGLEPARSLALPLSFPPDALANQVVECTDLGDLTSDGLSDLFVAMGNATIDRWFVGLSTGPAKPFAWRELETPPGGSIYGVNAASRLRAFGGGATDLVVADPRTPFPGGTLFVFAGSDLIDPKYGLPLNPVLVPPRQRIVGQASGYLGYGIGNLGELRGDNSSYLAVQHMHGAVVRDVLLYATNGSGLAPQGVFLADVVTGILASVGDVDGDGFPDALIPAQSGAAALLLFGGPDGPSLLNSTTLFHAAGAAGDINGDGRADLVEIGREITGVPSVVWFNSSSGQLETLANLSIDANLSYPNPPVPLSWSGDLSGDGRPDPAFVVRRNVTPVLLTYDMFGNATVAPILGALDIDADGTNEWEGTSGVFGPEVLNVTGAFQRVNPIFLPVYTDPDGMRFRTYAFDVNFVAFGQFNLESLEIAYTLPLELNLTVRAAAWLASASAAEKSAGIPLNVSMSGGSLEIALASSWDLPPQWSPSPPVLRIPEEGSLVPALDLAGLVSDDLDPSPSLQLVRPTGVPATFALAGGNLTIRMDAQQGAVNWTGNFTLGITAQDDAGLRADLVLQVQVYNVNDAPILNASLGALDVLEGRPTAFDLSNLVTDSDNISSDLRIRTSERNASIDGLTVTFLFPSVLQQESRLVQVWVSDGLSEVRATLTLHLVPVDDPPVIGSVGGIPWVGPAGNYSLSVLQGARVVVYLQAEDPEGLLLRLKVDDATAFPWVKPDQGNLSLVLTPGNDAVGLHLFTLRVDDGVNSVVFLVRVTVVNVNDLPHCTVASPWNGSTWPSDRPIQISASCTDPDSPYGDVLSYEWLLNGSTLVASNSSGQVGPLPGGNYSLVLQVRDQEGEVRLSGTFSVWAVPGNGSTDGSGEPPAPPAQGLPLVALLVAALVASLGLLGVWRWRRRGAHRFP